MDKKNILKIIFSLIIGLVLATFCMLKYIYVKFHGYDNLIKVLDNVTGYDATYMNFGYWGGRENKETLTEANKTLCEHNITMKTVKKKGGICEGKLQIKISGNKIINKSGIRTLHCSDIDEGLLKISKILNIKKNNIFLV